MNRSVLVILLLLYSCVSMNEVAVYQYEILPTAGIDGFTSTEIFTKGGGDEVWGSNVGGCNPLQFSELDASVDYAEDNNLEIAPTKPDLNEINVLPSASIEEEPSMVKNSLHIVTDYPGTCEWIGMGIGWDGWQGKDLSKIMDKAAIEMMVRVDGHPTGRLPIVFILEDYSGNQCYATAGALGIAGGEITKEWTRVVVPLPTFSYTVDNIDLTNIKQLLMQCYDKTDVYIDNMKIVRHEHHFKKHKPHLYVQDTIFPLDIFTGELDATWGINEQYCDNFTLNSNSIYVEVEEGGCEWNQFGLSWNKWLYTNLSESIHGVNLRLNAEIANCPGASIALEDYSGKKMEVQLMDFAKVGEAKEVKIPLRSFPIRKSEIDLKRIKSIVFTFENGTEMKLSNIRLTN